MNPLERLKPTERFSMRAQDYARYRPSYPDAVVQTLSREAGLTPQALVADVGAGTGIMSELLLTNGNTVVAVEPNAEMRSLAEKRLGGRRGFRSVDGTAEATTLDPHSVDAVICAQAFHWFDPAGAVREFARIVRPTGFIALLWNIRDNASPFMRDYELLIRSHDARVAGRRKDHASREVLEATFGSRLRFRAFPHHHELDWEGFRGRLISSSYIPLPGMDGFDQMLRDLREIFDRHQSAGHVRMQYETQLFFLPADELPGGLPA